MYPAAVYSINTGLNRMSGNVFVFGSNEAGRHGGGAALYAYQRKGARYGKGYGHYGESFALPTKDHGIKTLPLERIQRYVTGFLVYAEGNPNITFQVTQVGCGLAGYSPADIAPMFVNAPLNCQFDTAWQPFLGDKFTYWGHM